MQREPISVAELCVGDRVRFCALDWRCYQRDLQGARFCHKSDDGNDLNDDLVWLPAEAIVSVVMPRTKKFVVELPVAIEQLIDSDVDVCFWMEIATSKSISKVSVDVESIKVMENG